MASPEPTLTPMMAQYRRIKGELPKDALLLFRLGDFYEMFFEDAQIGAQLLNVALTMLHAERNNYLAAVVRNGKAIGIAVVDLTTGGFKTTEVESDASLLAEMDRLRPAEIVLPEGANDLKALLASFTALQSYDDWVFAPETAVLTTREHFKVASLDGFGLKNHHAAIGAAGAVLHYLTQHLRRDLTHLTSCSFYETSQFLKLDTTTLRHLEVLEPLLKDAPRNSTLCGALARTITPMGARCLRDWLSQPLAHVEAIQRRQQAVQSFINQTALLEAFRAQLGEVRDLERTIGRLSLGSGNARDLLALRQSLEQVPRLRRMLLDLESIPPASSLRELEINPVDENSATTVSLIAELTGRLTELPHVVELISRSIVDEPPLAVREGGMIRDGFDSSLDELHGAQRDGKDWIARLQQQEIERTGITSLKVRFNSVFGYFIEVTKSNLEKVPPTYVRKQTVATGERFITPELKEMEGKILGAEERSVKLEYELFLRVREQVLASLKDIQQTAQALAQLDVLGSFAATAQLFDYCCPQVGSEGVLKIRDGRHPVLEQNATNERFVPNDADLDRSTRQIALITGPNMAGKSTYIRQVALIALLAHTGSFVPARQARVDLLDRIFTRIGASDDLARGQSTFMVEMCETANILNNATASSLIVLDEIGRGTSTFDGLSLAWSIVEHLHNQVGAKTFFATHYHELTELAGRLPRVKNFNVAVREWNEQIVFLRKIVEGGTDKSYGIQVARLAGVPRPVLERAKEILRNLEESELTPEGNVRRAAPREREKLKRLAPAPQLDLFG
jgi:DNA mismatch repair protein MutS